MSPQAILDVAQTWQPGDPIPVDEHGQRHFVIEKRVLPWAPESLRAKVAEAIPYTEPVRPKVAPGALRQPATPPVVRPAVQPGPTRVARNRNGRKKGAYTHHFNPREIARREACGEPLDVIAGQIGCTVDTLRIRMHKANVERPPNLCIDCGEPTGRAKNAKRCLPCAKAEQVRQTREAKSL